jgi:hypothetical protein
MIPHTYIFVEFFSKYNFYTLLYFSIFSYRISKHLQFSKYKMSCDGHDNIN